MAMLKEKAIRATARFHARALALAGRTSSRAMRREGAQVTMEWVVVAAVVIILAVLLATVLRPAVQSLIQTLADEVAEIQAQV